MSNQLVQISDGCLPSLTAYRSACHWLNVVLGLPHFWTLLGLTERILAIFRCDIPFGNCSRRRWARYLGCGCLRRRGIGVLVDVVGDGLADEFTDGDVSAFGFSF